jgi:hypothetical protein
MNLNVVQLLSNHIFQIMSCSIITGPLSALTGHLSSDDEDGSDKKKSKRGVLPKSATQVMKSWLFQHIVVC